MNCEIIDTNCTSCKITNTFRKNEIPDCLCMDGYFEEGVLICSKCDYQCLTCKTNSSNCLSCKTTSTNRNSNPPECSCKDGYYDIGNYICEKCPHNCETCNNTGDCITC